GVAPSGAPAGPPLLDFRARQGQDEDRYVASPIEKMVEEVEQAGIGVLQILDQHRDRTSRSESLEEQPPPSEQLLAWQRRRGRGLDAEQAGQPRRHILAFRRIG